MHHRREMSPVVGVFCVLMLGEIGGVERGSCPSHASLVARLDSITACKPLRLIARNSLLGPYESLVNLSLLYYGARNVGKNTAAFTREKTSPLR